jgi:hypothetical protein
MNNPCLFKIYLFASYMFYSLSNHFQTLIEKMGKEWGTEKVVDFNDFVLSLYQASRIYGGFDGVKDRRDPLVRQSKEAINEADKERACRPENVNINMYTFDCLSMYNFVSNR